MPELGNRGIGSEAIEFFSKGRGELETTKEEGVQIENSFQCREANVGADPQNASERMFLGFVEDGRGFGRYG